MSQNKFSDDSFEKLAELGGGSAQNKPTQAQMQAAAQAAGQKQTESHKANLLTQPFDFISSLYGPSAKGLESSSRVESKGNGKNSTPLDTNKLNSKYTAADMAAWRKRHNQFSQEIEQAIAHNKKAAQEKVRQEEQLKQQKADEARRHAEANQDTEVQGKVKQVIGGKKPKRTVQTERNPETKVSGSK